ncbi:hypothetical protein [Pseudoroseicyclus aestuarii]|uniref:hypothetical protein n=1 Tax=Pseudoroseicyclus aestuarii TaxID=1795041 RepID=UPI0011B6FAF5|nr:hypothetical protein [Pseudoroseicyclus aestuarii]
MPVDQRLTSDLTATPAPRRGILPDAPLAMPQQRLGHGPALGAGKPRLRLALRRLLWPQARQGS